MDFCKDCKKHKQLIIRGKPDEDRCIEPTIQSEHLMNFVSGEKDHYDKVNSDSVDCCPDSGSPLCSDINTDGACRFFERK